MGRCDRLTARRSVRMGTAGGARAGSARGATEDQVRPGSAARAESRMSLLVVTPRAYRATCVLGGRCLRVTRGLLDPRYEHLGLEHHDHDHCAIERHDVDVNDVLDREAGGELEVEERRPVLEVVGRAAGDALRRHRR
jgi:hypothetical protein